MPAVASSGHAAQGVFSRLSQHFNHGRVYGTTCKVDAGVGEIILQLPKARAIKRHIYAIRQDAEPDVFGYIEGFYNRVRRQSQPEQSSPQEFEQLRAGS